ncbi:MAG: hypothetical protein JO045_25840, partial [Mycobacterium sp.]|nr:hypothetical protein [Mycobacterium sp.]
VLASLEIYKASDGHIYAVDLASTSTPGPQQVSNESSATIDDACSLTGTGVVGANSDYLGVLYVPDSVTPTNSRYFYRLPGPDGVCNTADDVIRMVSTSTPSNAAPATVPAMPITGVASQLGGIMGFVAKSGASLLLYDANFANPVLLGTFPSAIGVATPLPSGLVQGSPTGQLYVVDGSIYFVNYASPSITGPLFALPTWTPTVPNTIFAASPTTLYFAVNTPASGATPASASIYSMPGDGSAAPSLLVSLPSPSVVAEMQFPLQSTNLIYGAIISGGYSIYALAQGGTTPLQLFVPTQNGGTFTATATSVYYTTWNATNNTTNMTITRTQTQSGIVGVNGSTILAPVANSLFASGGEYVPYPLTVGAAVTVQTPLVTVFQVQGLSPVTVSSATTGYTYTVDGASGGTLSSIDTASNLKLATLGTVPAGTATFLSVNMRDTNHTGFVDASNFASTQNPMTHDTYLINSYNSSTLERVTANL